MCKHTFFGQRLQHSARLRELALKLCGGDREYRSHDSHMLTTLPGPLSSHFHHQTVPVLNSCSISLRDPCNMSSKSAQRKKHKKLFTTNNPAGSP